MTRFQENQKPEEKKLLSINSPSEVIEMNTQKIVPNESFNQSNKSFDSFQKDGVEVKTSDKRKKYRKTAEHVAGKVTESIGSYRNITEEAEWVLDGKKKDGSSSVELKKKVRKSDFTIEDSSFGFSADNSTKYQPKYVSGDLTSDRKRKTGPNTPSNSTYNFEYPDARVAQRLASYERLPSTYDNVKIGEQYRKTSNSTKNIDL